MYECLWETEILERFEVAETIPLPVAAVWDAHEDVRFLERLIPPFPLVRLKESNLVAGLDTQLTLRFELFGIGADWRLKITHWDPPVCFKDEQVSGPFQFWEHTHRFMALTAESTRIVDSVKFELNPLLDGTVMRWGLEALFKLRMQNLKQALISHSISAQ
ncbi:MAG: SRPBCC family protein [Coleofasciculaceae cyanobacterium]